MNKKKSLIRALIIITAVSFIAGIQIGTAKESGKSQLGGGGLYKATGSPRATLVNINQMSVWTRADGFSSRNPMTGNSGVIYPRGTAGVIFADGILWGGLVKDGQSPELRVGGATYISGTLEGAITSKGVQESPSDADVRIWRIRDDWKTADLRQDASEFFDIPLSSVSDGQIATIRAQYGTDQAEWPTEKGAPFYDINDNGIYEPDFDGDGVLYEIGEDDRPGIAGADQVVWFVRNDLSVGAVTGFLGSPPVGMEIQEALWGYARTDALGNMIFKKVVLIYKGTSDTPDGTGALPAATIEEMFLTQWSDPDLGDFGDDFAGSVPELSLGYTYNSSSIDVAFRDFGLPPPAVGYDFFQGPIVDSPGDSAIFNLKVVHDKRNLPMSSFVFFAAGSSISDPPLGTYEGTIQWYNLMHGLIPTSGNPFVDPNTGIATKFTLSGDPKTGEGWVDGNPLGPGDRRFLLSAGPFTMAFQDTQELVISLIAGIGGDRISSIDVLKFYDITAQNAFDNLFDLPTPPAAPRATAIALDKQIVIAWGNEGGNVENTEVNSDSKGYTFEGYNVYQLPSVTSTLAEATKLVTFDVANEITTILDPTFEPVSGQILLLPSQIGKNSGIERSLIINTDSDGNGITNYHEYYYAVTAYNNNSSADVPVHALESPPVILTVIPQPADAGVRYAFTAGQMLTSAGDDSSITHTGTANATAEVQILDPSSTITADWTLTMNGDGAGSFWYNLENEADGIVLGNLTNLSSDDDRIMRKGMTVKVLGSFDAPVTWFDDNTVGANLSFWGDSQLFGSATGFWFEFGSPVPVPTINQAQIDLEYRFTGVASDNDSPVTSGGSFSTQWPRDAFGGTGTEPNVQLRIPFELWDIESNDGAGRQLEVAVINRNADAGAPTDYIPYDSGQPNNNPGASDGFGTSANARWRMAGRDYIVVLNRDYQDDANFVRSIVDPSATWMHFFEQGGASVWATGDVHTMNFANPLQVGLDTFTFSTTAPAATAAAQDEDHEAINVFPNPYLGVNNFEVTRSVRWVRFTHLPAKATIRIFNLAGIHVATVDKNDNLQHADWNLNNWNSLPVASGIYLAHVSLADGFEKTLKLMIVQEQQFLQNF